MNRGNYIYNANLSIRKYIFSELAQSTFSIHIKLNAITLSVTNNFTKKLVGFVHYPINNMLDIDFIISKLKSLKEEEELMNHKYEDIQVILYENPYIVLPTDFPSEDIQESFGMITGQMPECLIENSTLRDRIKIVSLISEKSKKSIEDLFPKASIQHYLKGYLQYIYNFQYQQKTPQVFLHVLEDHIDIVAFSHEELLLLNRFEYHRDEDILYYLLSMMEQLELNPETIQVYYSGQLHEQESGYKLLKNYIRHVELCPYLLSHELHAPIKEKESYFLDAIINSQK